MTWTWSWSALDLLRGMHCVLDRGPLVARIDSVLKSEEQEVVGMMLPCLAVRGTSWTVPVVEGLARPCRLAW